MEDLTVVFDYYCSFFFLFFKLMFLLYLFSLMGLYVCEENNAYTGCSWR